MSKDTYYPVVVIRNGYFAAASLISLHGENKQKPEKTGHS